MFLIYVLFVKCLIIIVGYEIVLMLELIFWDVLCNVVIVVNLLFNVFVVCIDFEWIIVLELFNFVSVI